MGAIPAGEVQYERILLVGTIFFNPIKQEVIDITVASPVLLGEWKILNDITFSDHRCVDFVMDRNQAPTTPFRIRRKQIGQPTN